MNETFCVLLSLFASACTMAGLMVGAAAVLGLGAWALDVAVSRMIRTANMFQVIIEYAVYRRRFRAWLGREKSATED